MNIDFTTNCAIIVNFPAFSGGKFIMNCLSLSRHATPQSKKATLYLINNPDDYNYRLNAVLSTLPPFDDMKNWRQRWEFVDDEFYNGSVAELLDKWKHNKHVDGNTNQMLSSLISKKMCFFFTSHGGASDPKSEINQLTNVWTNAKIITLINSKKFWNIAVNIKQQNTIAPIFVDYAGNECWNKYKELKGSSWPEWHLFEKCHYDVDKVLNCVKLEQSIVEEMKQFYKWNKIKNNKFCLDVDNNFFNKENFLKIISELYDWIGFDDFNSVLIEEYYQQYMSLHTTTN